MHNKLRHASTRDKRLLMARSNAAIECEIELVRRRVEQVNGATRQLQLGETWAQV